MGLSNVRTIGRKAKALTAAAAVLMSVLLTNGFVLGEGNGELAVNPTPDTSRKPVAGDLYEGLDQEKMKKMGLTLVDDKDESISYDWQYDREGTPGNAVDGFRQTATYNQGSLEPEIRFTFTGTYFAAVMRTGTGMARLHFTIDGEDLGSVLPYYDSEKWAVVFAKDDLAPGTHTVQITLSAGADGGAVHALLDCLIIGDPFTVNPVPDTGKKPAVGDMVTALDQQKLADMGMTFVDDRDGSIAFGWQYDACLMERDWAYNGTTKNNGWALDPAIEYTFTGGYIAVVMGAGPRAAKVCVTIDGENAGSVIPYNGSDQCAVVFAADNLGPGEHTIKLTLEAGMNTDDIYAEFDAFIVGKPTESTERPQVGDSAADLDVDALEENRMIVVDDRDGSIKYTWRYNHETTQMTPEGAFNRTAKNNGWGTDSVITYTFTGSYIAVVMAEGPSAAKVLFTIDGEDAGSVTPYSAVDRYAVVFVKDDLDFGEHTISISLEKGVDNYAAFDAFIIGGDPSYEGDAPVFNDAITADPTISVYKNQSSRYIDCSAAAADGGEISYRLVTAPEHGRAIINAQNGLALYIPEEGYSGPDSFEIRAMDGHFVKEHLTVQVTVLDEENPQQHPALAPEAPQKPTAAQTPKAPVLSLPETERARSLLTDLGLSGFVGENIEGNIQEWLTVALENNPNIIDEIVRAAQGYVPLSSVMVTGLASGRYDLSIVGGENAHQLKWTNLNDDHFTDVDFYLHNDASVDYDWRGAKYLWFYVDASEYTEGVVPIKVAFEEYNPEPDGGQSANPAGRKEAWQLKAGAGAYLYSEADGWQEVKASSTHSIPVPAGYVGWVSYPISTDTMECYFSAQSGIRHVLDLNYVHQLQIHVEGEAGKSVYFDDFAVSGDVLGEEPPVQAHHTGDTFKVVWDLNHVIMPMGGGELPIWYNEFPGKLLTGMAYCYRLEPDPALLEAGNTLAAALRDAQGEDGYLGIYIGSGRMGGMGHNWDVWGHYHCIYGLYQWYLITGDSQVLDIALKAADYVYEYFTGAGRSYDSAGWQTMNLAVSHGFALLYQETGDTRYLNAAKQIVLEEWPKSGNWLQDIQAGKDYYQSALPRWEALHTLCTLGNLYEITGDAMYYKALEDIWYSIAKTDRHNTGGFTSGEQATGNPFDTGAIETCCTVAWMALSTEYLQLSHNSYAADELELSYFNGMLGALLEDDKYVTYDTPMDGSRYPAYDTLSFQYYYNSADFSCCQANAGRGLGELSQWGVLTGKGSLYLNYYGPSEARTQTPGGHSLVIRQDTAYPRDGAITITLKLEQAERFALNLRIPTWSFENSLTVNGQAMTGLTAGEYYVIDREWKDGDVLELNLEMRLHYWLGEDSFEGKTAVYYGPVLLVLDTAHCLLPLDEITLQTIDLESMTVTKADDGCWLHFDTVTVDGTPVRLVDFASAGHGSSPYISWLKVNCQGMDYLPYVKGGNPVWNNSPELPSYSVTVRPTENGTVTLSAETVVFGGSVGLTVTPNQGYRLKTLRVNGLPVEADNVYDVCNVRRDTVVEAVFEGAPAPTEPSTPTDVSTPPTEDSEKPTGGAGSPTQPVPGTGGSLPLTALGLAGAAAAAVLVIRKKKRG